MTRFLLNRFIWLNAFLAGICCTSLSAAESTDRLLSLVDRDAGMCIEISDPARRWSDWSESEPMRRLQKSQFYNTWRDGQDYQNLQKLKGFVSLLLNQPIEQFAGDFLGQSIVAAVYPGENDKPVLVILTETKGPETIDRFLSAFERADKKYEFVQREHQGKSYTHRRLKQGKSDDPELSLVRFGSVMGIASDESAVRRMIEMDSSARGDRNDRTASIRELPEFEKARASLSSGNAVRCYVRPRAWDHVVRIEPNSPIERFMAETWKRTNWIALGLAVGDETVLEATLQFDNDDPPDDWNRFVSSTAGDHRFANRIPGDVLAAFSGQVVFHDISNWLPNSEAEREELTKTLRIVRGLLLGQNLISAVLPKLGPSWCVYAVPKTLSAQHRDNGKIVPADVLLAVQIREGETRNDDVSIRDGLDNALQVGLNLAAIWMNSQPTEQVAVVRSRTQDTQIERWVDTTGPYQPAYALTGDELVVSTSRELVVDFLSEQRRGRLIEHTEFPSWRSRHFPQAGQWIFANVSEVRRWLADHRQFFIEQAVRDKGVSHEVAQRQLSGFEDVIRLFDGAFLSAQWKSDRVRLVMGLATSESAQALRNSSPERR